MNKLWLEIVLCFFLILGCSARLSPQDSQQSSPSLKLRIIQNKHVEITNGIVTLTLLKQGGLMSGIGYNGVGNLLEIKNLENYRGYWDIVWSRPGSTSTFDTLRDTSYEFSVVSQTDDKVEVSFRRIWNTTIGESDQDLFLNIDKRYVMLRGSSGFYTYAIFEHEEGWPALNIDETRVAFKLNQDMFHYMAISDDIQRIMPTAQDRESGHILDYKEAVLLTNPSDSKLKGEVDDKYQYSMNNKDNKVHGWISNRPKVGFWVITPNDEFRAGSPFKPDLTSHIGPTSLATFHSDHYAGDHFGVKIEEGEAWKKVYGPVFVYLNSNSGDKSSLWNDAKRQYEQETQKWPYDFPLSSDFPKANERGSITGRLLVHDTYMNSSLQPAKLANVGLAVPGDAGSWQSESMGYQFWTETNDDGYFTIKNVRPGTYNLYAWVPGFIGDYKYENDVVITAGSNLQGGELVYEPPRTGPTLWEIGYPDRTAAEFFIPDPAPRLMNKLLENTSKDKYRQYGLWDRYTDSYPTEDLVYTVGKSNYAKDWFFAHVPRKINGSSYIPTTWQIAFDVQNVVITEAYTLRIALASASYAEIQVRVNNPYAVRHYFTTGRIGKDNAIARHGIHGQQLLFNVNIPGYQLVNGKNIIYLRQSRAQNSFMGVLYDYIRLEGPSES